ncbi:hypothetical protein B0H13DRAFT_1982661 [Mycena leptocephala]|nr:hypothetical protein B0H13DRAFT_1982661 [Mycena leptocephala]
MCVYRMETRALSSLVSHRPDVRRSMDSETSCARPFYRTSAPIPTDVRQSPGAKTQTRHERRQRPAGLLQKSKSDPLTHHREDEYARSQSRALSGEVGSGARCYLARLLEPRTYGSMSCVHVCQRGGSESYRTRTSIPARGCPHIDPWRARAFVCLYSSRRRSPPLLTIVACEERTKTS